jgi:hypothetical protein
LSGCLSANPSKWSRIDAVDIINQRSSKVE